MRVGVVYAGPRGPQLKEVEVPEQSTVSEAIHRSGLLEKFPQIDLQQQKVGIFGKLAKLDAQLKEGDRVEIYRAITADPKTVKRRDTGSGEDSD
jgi:putative ubiquitin-RnfH superfamily antitoxin RatB of RatAB toxin-antitoxin module